MILLLFQYFSYSISITLLSWFVGMAVNALLKKKSFYNAFSNFNFMKSKALNEFIGLNFFKILVKETYFKHLNQKIKLDQTIDLPTLTELRKEMTYAEVSHLIAFAFVAILALLALIYIDPQFAFMMMAINTLLNVYPSLLQQENKRRLDRLIGRLQRLSSTK